MSASQIKKNGIARQGLRFRQAGRALQLGLAFFAVLMALAAPAFGQDETDENMAQSIMALRADIEALYTQIDDSKERYKAQMKTLDLEAADLEVQISRKNTDINLANLELDKIKEKIADASGQNVDLGPLLANAFDALEESIKNGFPFKTEERLADLGKIRDDVDANLISQERALALLWASYEDNIRLTKEIGLFKQNIILEGKRVLATIAKIGTVMLYFDTPDGQVGYAAKKGAEYTFVAVDDQTEKDQIVALFDSLNKQIRTGYFTLPNVLAQQGTAQ
jgi:hypothetical protein